MNAHACVGLGRNRCKLPRISRQIGMSRLGTWNVRGINGEEKRREVMDVFRKGRFDLLALTETRQR